MKKEFKHLKVGEKFTYFSGSDEIWTKIGNMISRCEDGEKTLVLPDRKVFVKEDIVDLI